MKKRYLLVLIVFLSFVTFASAKQLKIELTEKEKHFLQSHPIIRLGTDETWFPYISKNKNGELEGLDIDVIHYINETSGANIQLVVGKWSDIIKKAKKYEIDGLATSAPLDARKPFFNFTESYISDFPIFVLPAASQLNIKRVEDLSGKRVAVQEGNEFFTSILQPYSDVEMIQTGSEREAIKIMLEGKADVSLSSTSTYFSHQNKFLSSIKIGYVLTEKSLDIVYSVRKDWPELVSIINKSLSAMPVELHNEIYKKWFQINSPVISTGYKNKIEFTKAEKDWVQNHPVIRVANETDWPPFDFNVDGTAKGLSIDLMRLLAHKSGIKLEFVYGYTWKKLVELFEEKKIDVMPALYMNEERKKFTLFTTPYFRGKLGVFTNSDNTSLNDNLINKKVGMETSHGSIPLIIQKIPGIVITEIDSKDELVKKLATNELDAIIGNPFVFYYLAREFQIENIQLSNFITMNEDEQRKTSLHIGIRNDYPILHQILQKAMDNTSEKEMEEIRNKWANIRIVNKINWKIIFQISLVIFSVFIFLVWNNRRLQYKVQEKTKALRDLNESLELKVEKKTKELTETNKKLTQSLNEIKTLRGIIPICAYCKNIRNDQGYWNKIEEFISEHSEAEFSHSICDKCLSEKYPEDEGG